MRFKAIILYSGEELDVCTVQMTCLVWLILFSFIQLKLIVETAKDVQETRYNGRGKLNQMRGVEDGEIDGGIERKRKRMKE